MRFHSLHLFRSVEAGLLELSIDFGQLILTMFLGLLSRLLHYVRDEGLGFGSKRTIRAMDKRDTLGFFTAFGPSI
jgi:hypothetical protein